MRTEYLKNREINQVRSRRRKLEEVLIDALAMEHPLGIHPEVDLVISKQYRRRGKEEKVEVQVDANGRGKKHHPMVVAS